MYESISYFVRLLGQHLSHCANCSSTFEKVKNCIYACIFENRASKSINSFYYLASKNNKTRPKAD